MGRQYSICWAACQRQTCHGVLTATAKRHRITCKPEDSFAESKVYDFIGMKFNHNQGTVTPSKKILDKLNASSFDAVITAGDL